MPWRFSIDAAYVGNRGVDFAYIRNLNQLPSATPSPIPAEQHADAVRPYSGPRTSTHRVRREESESRAAGAAHAAVRTELHGQVGTRFEGRDHVDATTRLGYSSYRREWGRRDWNRRIRSASLRLPDAERGDQVVQQPHGRVVLDGGRSRHSRFLRAAALTITPTQPGTTGAGCARGLPRRDLYRRADAPAVVQSLVFGRPLTVRWAGPPRIPRGPGINQWDVRSTRNEGGGAVMVQFRLETFTRSTTCSSRHQPGVNVPNAGQRDCRTRDDGAGTSYRDPRRSSGVEVYF